MGYDYAGELAMIKINFMERILVFKGAFFVGVWTLIWLLLIDLSIATGGLWGFISDHVSYKREYALQNQLFASDVPGNINWLFVGDEIFISKIKTSQNKEGNYFLSIPDFSLADIAAIKSALGSVTVERIVIQASPYMWTNYWFKAPPLNVKLWVNYDKYSFVDLGRAKIFFSELKKCTKTKKGHGSATTIRPASLMATEPFDDPRNSRNYLKNIKKMVKNKVENIYWLRDTEGLPEDIPEEVMQSFDEKFGMESFIEDFGNIVIEMTTLENSA